MKNQEAGRAKNGRLESGPGQFGVVRRVTAEEDTMENNTMYSCGSLAPKMKATVSKYVLDCEYMYLKIHVCLTQCNSE